ncbi:MAG TPA: PilZ domain-containing protein [Candidatus Omnitrophota bacterium]|nr:PilZ domain-containing protein [Candidatus Omnitrophota bacterium]
MGILDRFSRVFGTPWFNRRKVPRVSIGDRIDVAFWTAPRYRFEYGELEDLSAGGARFLSYIKLSKGTRFELNIHLPAAYPMGRSLRCNARIVYCCKGMGQKRYRIGCEFEGLETPDTAEIEKFLSWVKLRKQTGPDGTAQ